MSEGNESQLRTFRLDADIVKGLDYEATKQGATVNGIACRVLKRYIRITTKLDHFGMVALTKDDLLAMISSMNEELIAKVGAKVGGSLVKEVILQLYGDTTVETFRLYLDKILCSYQGWASYTEEEKGDQLEIRLGHTMGQKWAIFLSSYIDAALGSFTTQKADFKYISNYSIIFTISQPEAPQSGQVMESVDVKGSSGALKQ